MIIFKDILTGDEMFTDSSKIKCIDDCIWEVKVKYVTRAQGDIQLDGSNPSAEEFDEGTEEGSESGYDVVLNQRMVATYFKKSEYKTYLKSYSKSLVEKWKSLEWDEEKINMAKGKIMEAAKKVFALIDDDTTYYMGESSDPDGGVGILAFRSLDDGNEEAFLVFLKYGLEEEKV